jgi:MoxR-like ATPase
LKLFCRKKAADFLRFIEGSKACKPMAHQIGDIESVIDRLGKFGYVADRALATAIYLLVKLGKPLLIEGHAGVGKTEVAKALASFLETELIRLQCYEGLDHNSAVYEWNYQKQLLAIKIQEGSDKALEEKERYVFGSNFLLQRPLLRSILCDEKAPVLLVDEIDRADEAFEALLLELLAEFQITIPELGTIRAKIAPLVILTSNGSRELSDALKRRCLYHWIDYPDLEKELEIVRVRLPEIPDSLSSEAVRFVHAIRSMDLSKRPGIAETLDLSRSLVLLEKTKLDREGAEETLGCILKSSDDFAKVRSEGIDRILLRAGGSVPSGSDQHRRNDEHTR